MIEVKDLRIGVEIGGVDLSRALDGATADRLRALYNERHLLVFRDQDLSVLDQWRAVSIFGTILNESSDGSGVMYVSGSKTNIKSDRLLFHSDNHFTPVPVELLSLYAEELDESATTTLFLDNVEAYEKLAPELRERIDGADVEVRTYFHRGYSDRPARTIGQDEDDEDGPIARHPAVWRQPATGKPFVYLTELGSHHLVGIDRAESDTILDAVFGEMYQPDRQYEHHWRQGDYVLWNNRTIQHARGPLVPGKDGGAQVRSIRRVAGGSVGFAEQFRFSDAALARMEERKLTGYVG